MSIIKFTVYKLSFIVSVEKIPSSTISTETHTLSTTPTTPSLEKKRKLKTRLWHHCQNVYIKEW